MALTECSAGNVEQRVLLQRAAVEALGKLAASDNANQKGHQDAAAAAIPRLLRLMQSDNLLLQTEAVRTLGLLVTNHENNQRAAFEGGAISLLLQLMQPTGSCNDLLPCAAVETLGFIVYKCYCIQSAITQQQLDAVLNIVLSHNAACDSLRKIVGMHFPNQQALHSLLLLKNRLPQATTRPNKPLGNFFEEVLLAFGQLPQLEIWCDEAANAASAQEFATVNTSATMQIGDSCFAFAAARSFNRR